MIAALTLAALAATTLPTEDPNEALPAEWAMGDFATPFTWGGHQLYVYADIADGNGRFARNAVSVGGELLIQPLTGSGDSFYWITDGTELPDGTLLVAALEVVNRFDLPADGWQFEIVDTDMFIVRDPTSAASWTVASRFGKIDDRLADDVVGANWWDSQHVEFSDQFPGLAFGKDVWCAIEGDCRGDVYTYIDVTDAERAARTPSGDGVFAPVQTADSWVGMAWDFLANTATVWSTDNLSGVWVEGETFQYEAGRQTHGHGLNVVDGQVLHRWSTLRQRPTFEVWSET